MSAPPSAAGAGPPARSPVARRVRTVAVAALVLAALAAGTYLAVGSRPPARPATVATQALPAPAPSQLRVVSVSGAVERADSGGAWRQAAAGGVLLPDQQLRAGPGARAELSAADGGRIVLSDRTHVLVRELTADLHRFQLSRGLVTVDYPLAAARRVRVEAAAGGAIAESRAAHFHVSANGLAFAVATRSGSVELSAAGSSVAVGAGQLATVVRTGAPTPPRPIPTQVLLKVAAASALPPGRCLDTTGRTDPSSRAFVDGEEVQVGEDGRFPIRVAGARPAGVAVRVVGPDGREVVRSLPCGAGPAASIRDLRMRWSRDDP